MKLSQLLTRLETKGNFTDCEINSITDKYDAINPGDVFVCIKGNRFDAHTVAKQAIEEKGAAAVSKAADVINKTLGTDIKVGEGLNKVIAGAENIQKNIVDRAVNDVGAVLDGQKLDEFVDDKKEEIGEATKGIREDIDKAKKDLNTVKGAAENVSDQVDTAKSWNDKRKEITGKDKLDEPIEFEEEEEEVSNEENIANLKKYFATIKRFA